MPSSPQQGCGALVTSGPRLIAIQWLPYLLLALALEHAPVAEIYWTYDGFLHAGIRLPVPTANNAAKMPKAAAPNLPA